MSTPSYSLSSLTSGLLAGSSGTSDSTDLLTQGMMVTPLPLISTVNANEALPGLGSSSAVTSSALLTDVAATSTQNPIYDAAGNLVSPLTAASSINVGNGNLNFDPTTLQGVLTPTTGSSTSSGLDVTQLPGDTVLFSGADIRIMIEVADPLGPTRWSKQFLECTTLTISIHRVKDPARSCGFIGARGYSRGGRTIAGTFVLTELGKDALYEFLSAFALRDKSKDSNIAKVDQIPPFNISLLFANEYGYASSRRLLGVDMVTDGTVYSVNDAYSERTISYVASDLTPLLPVSLKSLQAAPQDSDPSTQREMSPMDVMTSPATKTVTSDNLIAYS
jgi:hypothetical protein